MTRKTVLAVAFLGLCTARTASAEIIRVPQDYSTIQSAINAAVNGDEIIVAPGTYNEAVDFLGKAVTLRSTDPSDPAIVAATIIDATGLGQVSVVTCNTSEGSDTILDGFTITRGTGTDLDGSALGGGMHNVNSSPTVTNCTFSGNTADFGGGMVNVNSSPTVTNCTFSGNTADFGGGMVNGLSSPTVTNCTFSGNAAESDGGGMYHYGSDAAVTNCTFSGNTADFGGGMSNILSSPMVTNCTFKENSAGFGGGMFNDQESCPTVTGCTFTGNTANAISKHGHPIGTGGGMLDENNSNPEVIDCTFTDNTARVGGAMSNENNSDPNVTGCTFTGNTAIIGGAMRNLSNSDPEINGCTFTGNTAASGGAMSNRLGSSPTLTNCLFSGNTATSRGGAMSNLSASSPTVTNCAFSGNTATNLGGAMYNVSASSPAVKNCIMWNNSPNEINGGATVRYSDVQGGWPGMGNIDFEPLFVDADGPDDIHGNEDDNLRLQAGSPCIDAGDNTAVPDGIMTDFDGNPRFVDDPNTPDSGNPDGINPLVDMGAYEFEPTDPCADEDGDGKVTICHAPPGNPDNAHTITVRANAVPAHQLHGDHCGPCP